MPKDTIHLTCVFKVHTPSAHKRAVMDYALHEYSLAYQRLLDWARAHDDLLREHGLYNGKMNTKALAAVLPRLSGRLHSSAYDSLGQDVGGNLASYYALAETAGDTGFPLGRDPSPQAEQHALDHFVLVGSDPADYDDARNRYLAAARGQYMPLFFCRSEAGRNFTLLANGSKRQLLAVLYLLPKDHALTRPIEATQGNLYTLNTGEIFRSRSASAILVPLEVGRNDWQMLKFLEPTMQGKAQTKAAFLVKRGDDYYLHVTFEYPCPPIYEPRGYLGVDKGILITTAYALVDLQGTVQESGLLDEDLRQFLIETGRLRKATAQRGKGVNIRHYKQQEIEARLHRLANALIAKAKEARAGLVVEDLNPDFQVRGGLVVSRFRKFDHILVYKCKLEGVPFRRVFAAYSSIICPACGENLNRSADRQQVSCPTCEYSAHADQSAAVNIARRALYRKAEWESYREFHRAFARSQVSALLQS